MNATFYRDGCLCGHAVSKATIKCQHDGCTRQATHCEYTNQSAPFCYFCFEHSSIPTGFERGEVVIVFERRDNGKEYQARFLPNAFQYIGPTIEFRHAKSLRKYKAFRMTPAEANSYAMNIHLC